MALSTQRDLPSSSSDAPSWKYDVFLSFRGEDTRRGFISHLYHELQYWQTIRAFKDDRELEIGASISPLLLSAIEESHLAIIVLSLDYASSAWCLDELAKIVESMETRDANIILPVFFDVDPSDVRNQRRSFAEAFTKHEAKFSDDMEKVERWRKALRRVANLSGWDSKNYRCERELIKDIVRCVMSKVNPKVTLLDSTDKLVGIDFGQLDLLLAPEVNDVRFIGIWGMGGVGKTTLVKLVFERISHHFTVTSFLVNVRDVSARHGTLVDLQKQLLFPIMKENIACVWDEEQGTYFIRKLCSNKKVLLVVDDIDQHKQLKLLVGNKSWFGEGSRIIVTTRDERVLVENDIDISFKVNQLNHAEALQLFSQNAFRRDEPEEIFLKLSKSFVCYAKGLPLALKAVGRSLYKRNLDAWNSALDKLKKIPIPTIFDCLKISYDPLDDMEKNIFLDMAFFYKGRKKGYIIEMLDSTGLCGLIGIDVLVEKSLLTIGINNNVEMHDLIQEMAKEIVRQESPNEPGLRSRLCNRDDINHVFVRNTGTEAIKGISLCLPPELEEVAADPSWNNEGFSKMSNLTNLEFDNFSISSAPKFLPNSLRSLKWSMYPSKSLPASYKPNLLVELQMTDSKLVRLWDGKLDLPNLKNIDLSGSRNLTNTPDLTGILNLEQLVLVFCSGLVEIHPSIAVHKKIKTFHVDVCSSTESFPSEINMDSLETFSFTNNRSKIKIPKFGRGMKKLSSVYLDGNYVKPNLGLLPPSVWKLRSLERLYLSNANLCEGDIPDDIGYILPSLRYLYLRGNNFVSLPSTIKCLSKLTLLDLSNCKRLQQLPVLWAEPSQDSTSNGEFELRCVNCFGLVNNERWNNKIILRQLASQGLSSNFWRFRILCPGSKIPEWFNIQSEGDSLTVELPSNRESCGSKWVGIAVCVLVAADQRYRAAHGSNSPITRIECSGKNFIISWQVHGLYYDTGEEEYYIIGDHVAISLIHRRRIQDTTSCHVKFQCLSSNSSSVRAYYKIPAIKRCGARLVCKQDLEELFHEPRNMFKRSREYCHDELRRSKWNWK